MIECRECGKTALSRVLDLGKVPAADYFPLATDAVRADEAAHALAMDVCRACGLAQLADDDTITDEPRGVEPQALKDQAQAAIAEVAAAGWLRGDTVVEFGSPHGGTWIPLIAKRINALLASFRCDLDRTYFDVPRMRTSTSDDYLRSGISYAFHPQRDPATRRRSAR